MSEIADIRKALRDLTKSGDEVYSIVCRVISVDLDRRTCEVEPINGSATLYDIRLQAKMNSSTGIILVPKPESDVIVTFLNKETGYIACTTEIDQVIIGVGDQEFTYDSNGLLLKSSVSDFRKEIDDLYSILDFLITTLEGFELLTSGTGGPTLGITFTAELRLFQLRERLKSNHEKLKTIFRS